MWRVFAIAFQRCGGPLRLVATLEASETTRRILRIWASRRTSPARDDADAPDPQTTGPPEPALRRDSRAIQPWTARTSCAQAGRPDVLISNRMPSSILSLAFTFLLLAPLTAQGQSAENVAVVINELSADSRRIGEHYAQARRIPDVNAFGSRRLSKRRLIGTRSTPRSNSRWPRPSNGQACRTVFSTSS